MVRMKRIGAMLLIFFTFFVVFMNCASADYGVQKYKSGFNYRLYITGNDLKNVKSSQIYASIYADYAANSIVDDYFRNVKTVGEGLSILAAFGVSIPRNLGLYTNLETIKKTAFYWTKYRISTGLSIYAPRYPNKLSIYTIHSSPRSIIKFGVFGA